jgi:hypothetical protein
LVMLHDVERTAHASLLSWLRQPSIELKQATSSVCLPSINHVVVQW